MKPDTFLALDQTAVAEQLRAAGSSCWAIAMGGTRRAYLAEGGTLSGPSDLEGYFRWAEAAQRAIYEQLFRFGVESIILIGRVPADRGPAYAAIVRGILDRLVCSEERLASYRQLGLRVQVAGDVGQLAALVEAPELPGQFGRVVEETAGSRGPNLVYLFRGSWYEPAIEEAQRGYELGLRLGRLPARDELVADFYGLALPPLGVYVGSGRARVGLLRPPFLSGNEDLYWAHGPLNRLDQGAWRRIIYDHLWARRTTSGRGYPDDALARAEIGRVLADQDGHILGLGAQHALGFWVAER
jgi:hypothetical protein